MSTSSTCSPRLVSASGTIGPRSTPAMESVRRYVQARLPRGAEASIALETGLAHRRVADEVEGVKALSADVLFASLVHLSLEDRLRAADHLMHPLGLHATAREPEPIDATAPRGNG